MFGTTGRQTQLQRVRLLHGGHRHGEQGQAVFVQMNELHGSDELSLEGVDTRSAIGLLARLLETPVGFDGSAEAFMQTLSASDRDALLAALHRRCWGDRIVSTMNCARCRAQFDLSFELSELQRQLVEQGRLRLQARFDQQNAQIDATPPTGEQELAAAESLLAGNTEEALRKLGADGDAASIAVLAQTLEDAAPIVDLELDADCAECGHTQQAHFDLQTFVLQRLLNERELLMHEIHTLALGYGWSLSEIVSLSRSRRRSFVHLLSAHAA